MSRFGQRFHLTCAIVASLTCGLWCVLTALILASHRAPARVGLLLPIVVLGGGAALEFKAYKDECKSKDNSIS